MDNLEYLVEYDKYKSKVLKYIVYKKRTKQEITTKFSSIIEEDMLEDIIEELSEKKYIDDNSYIQRAISEFMALKNLSIKEIKYKLFAKGLDKYIIDEYIEENIEELEEYECNSIKNIIYKKSSNYTLDEIKQQLMKKGYRYEFIRKAIEE